MLIIICKNVKLKVMISAFVVDMATVLYFLEFHDIILPNTYKQKPLVDLRSVVSPPQSASAKLKIMLLLFL
mgnify:CR=1 FL=1